MWHGRLITITRTALAMAMVVVSLLLTSHLLRWMYPPSMLLPLAAVVLAAWFWGWIPAMAAAMVAVAGSELFLYEIRWNWRIGLDDPIRLLVHFGTAALICHLTDRRKRAEYAVHQARNHLSLMTDALPVLVAYLDTSLRYRFTNRAHMDWLNLPDESLRGRHVRDVLGQKAFGQLQEYLESAAAGNVVSHETEVTFPNGRKHTILASYIPDRDEHGNVVGFASIVADVSERRRAEAAVRASEEKFRIMADSAPVMVWITDTETHCTWINHYWLDFTGRTLEQELGEGWIENVHPEDLPRFRDVYLTSADARLPFRMEFRLKRRDGLYRWLWTVGRPLFDADGNFTGYIGSCIDITDRKEHEQEREYLLDSERHARGEAERVSRLKDEFLASLSHELRTPLNAILGWAQLLRVGHDDPQDLAQGLEVIERNARVQTQIISDLLDMSRILSGKIRLEIADTDLPVLVHGAMDTVQHSADAKEIELVRQIDPSAGTIAADSGRLQQVLWNLLSNAIKFTPRGGKVTVRLERQAHHVELTISDTGQGIPLEFLPHVFERFRQADASTTRKFGGLGLGLSIVKSLVELHGGVIRCHSDGPGAGASFTITLPLVSRINLHAQPQTTSRHPAATEKLPVTRLDGVRVLAIDDEPDARELVRRLLVDHGAQVTTADTADEALRLLSAEPFDVLLADIGMPQRDGYELIREIRRGRAQPNTRIPAAAVTAFARSEDRTRALLSGYQSYVSKPFEPAELVAVVASLSENYGDQNSGQDAVEQDSAS